MKPSRIKDSLLKNPEAEQTLFAERARFDLIVYYDQNSSNNINTTAAMMNLQKLLVESQNQSLPRPPMMLIGGFDAWQTVIGDRGVYRFPTTTKEEKKHYWFKSSNSSNNSISSQSSNSDHEHHHPYHNTLYDYVSGLLLPYDSIRLLI